MLTSGTIAKQIAEALEAARRANEIGGHANHRRTELGRRTEAPRAHRNQVMLASGAKLGT
jgi:hypothetical protein